MDGMFTTLTLIILAVLFAMVITDLPRSEMQTCLDTYKVYSCSLKPDYSAFTPNRGVQI